MLDREEVLDRFQRVRTRTRAMFDLLDEQAYYSRPIALRNPIVFYEGHLPAFAVNTLIKRGLGEPGIDAHLETIFARGIDPESEALAVARGNPAWPSRAEVRAYAEEADLRIATAFQHATLEVAGHPLLDAAQAVWAILEHEEMHQETLAYMWHQLSYASKRKPVSYRTLTPPHEAPAADQVRIPAGEVTIGTRPAEGFAWDNERPAHCARVAAFTIDAYNVTNARFMAFVEAGGYQDPRWWSAADLEWLASDRVAHPPFWEQGSDGWYQRGMFERVPLPGSWPVYVTWAEANAYARWQGARLPTEAEFHRAAFGTIDGAERRYPWGETLNGAAPPANFDFRRWDPEPVAAHPEGASAFGVHDLVGNGWEWTATPFGPFDGFAPLPSYPEYSAEFFDGEHYVMKGASPVTARELTRRGFRNWFRPRYPYVYATFRCVR